MTDREYDSVAKKPRIEETLEKREILPTIEESAMNLLGRTGMAAMNTGKESATFMITEAQTSTQSTEQHLTEEESSVDILVNLHMKKESERKDTIINDLMTRLNSAYETIRTQNEQIKELQEKINLILGATQESNGGYGMRSNSVPIPTRPIGGTQFELRILQQPPKKAIYQRILRPFPSVQIVGLKSVREDDGFFVEVSLMKRVSQDVQLGALQPVDQTKKNLISGQTVQRTEHGGQEVVVAIFRKLKILTTTAQQGNSFFLLKFSLKKYRSIDNRFEDVPDVPSILSEPIEIFSHSLYLKDKPLDGKTNPASIKGAMDDSNTVA